MSRAVLVLGSAAIRAKAMAWIDKAPAGTRLEFKGPRRSLDQNAKLWAMLTDVAGQCEHCGHRYTPGQWKVLFMHACRHREVQFVPSLDGSTFIPWGQSSSDLSKAEMSELLDFIQSWGVEHDVVFHAADVTEAA